MVLEEAALTAAESDSPGLLWSPLSVRSVASSLGMGRASAAGALSALVSAGSLRLAAGRRGARGRFGAVGYWLTVPDGMVVVGLASSASDLTVIDGQGHGQSLANNSRLDSASEVAPSHVAPAQPPPSRARRRATAHSDSATQASLFGSASSTEADSSAFGESAPPVESELVGADERHGCELVDWVHELAPGVTGGADPHWNPNGRASRAGGGATC